jgi:hypothetical protein
MRDGALKILAETHGEEFQGFSAFKLKNLLFLIFA